MANVDERKKIEDIFLNTLKIIKEKSDNVEFFNKFICNLKIKNVQGNIITLICKNNFAKEIIKTNYLKEIKTAFNKFNNTNYLLEIRTENEDKVNVANTNYSKCIGLSNEYSFENMVCGKFNSAAISAGKSITTNFFVSPLFIYSNVGLGKTHLLHAIGNLYKLHFPHKNICYVSSDDFSRQIYNALSSNNKIDIENVKDEYNSYDLLLIDDIQILANRPKINEILFNIFEHSIRNKKLIVFTSDKNIDMLNGFENRIISRFHSGITVTINQTEIVDRIQIIKQKMNKFNNPFILNNEVLDFIAKRNDGDIRKLEGCVNQILFFATNNLQKYSVINLDIVKSILYPLNQQEIKNYGYDVNPEFIIEAISNNYGVKKELIKSKSKLKFLITPRNVCMYVLRKKFNMTYSQIGQLFSGRDHSTVMDSIKKIEKIIKSDPDLNSTIENIYKKI